MNVPNHEKKAFRDMTPEERSAIVEAHVAERVEILISGAWVEADSELIFPACAYRTRPRQLVIPWEHIKEEYQWAAMDENGTIYVFDGMPYIKQTEWHSGAGVNVRHVGALSIDTTGIYWRESLTARPEGV